MLEPLSSLLRPTTLDEFAWQTRLLWPSGPLRRFIEAGRIPSMIFWGPPGTGKTSMAYLISRQIKADFYHLSWVVSRKEDVTKIISKARENFKNWIATILFLDEIHRWNKAQQDTLLPFVEKGVITLIGATTENPSFTINNALISRSRVFVFDSISQEEMLTFFAKRKSKIEEIFSWISIDDSIFALAAKLSNGDLRNALWLLETAFALMWDKSTITIEDMLIAWEKPLSYDRDSDFHYDIISAVHKSLRDSDGDAAIYWIGRMLAWGEDPRFIARRMINFACEDVGLADPQAMILANTAYDLCEKIGMPEAELVLCELAYYLADAPKNVAVYRAMKLMRDDVRANWDLPVPMHIRNAPTKLMKDVGYGKWYEYSPDLPSGKSEQQHFPDGMKPRKYRE